ncbi:peptidoglycan-binding domain-containing protein [Streptomyces sp. BE133]|uniref:peptidoglycan-binding domain-containing protein n=1 Tax=Streptomyces sp. BE133 TaxID=3002523 RepID=UPI002E7613DD|nr:peptidoglycan-binding domain-containing protein [Streptomyces sp. BE133]MEE1806397.1 peptidoglycan-binding domain-containing protein [Streptomyces sp. BE133]
MRSNKVRALASVTALLGITAGTLAASGTAVAATPERHQTVVSGPASITEVVNLGLSTSLAKRVQFYLSHYAGVYTGAIDGLLGTESWKAMQRVLRSYGYTGAIDGIVGTGTIKALQQYLKSDGFYSGAIDGIAGSGTQAAFAAWANQLPMD